MQELEHLQKLFADYLAEHKFEESPKELYEPNNYFLSIGGKRIRPIMVLLGIELFDKDPKIALPAAFSIELFHNFTLIHDDIMDNAPLRRGFKTIHEKYNINTAILSGDVLIIKAYQFLSQIEIPLLDLIFPIFNKTAIEVCEGQQMDINFEKQDNVEMSEYLKMITLKTSVLLAASLQIGAIIGGASVAESSALYQYALNLGIAFQIQDDILDSFGDGEHVGKKIGGDILQNKKTLLSIKAHELENKNGQSSLQQIIFDTRKNDEEKINAVLAIYKLYNIKEFAETKRDSFVKYSIEALQFLNFSAIKKQKLEKLVKLLVFRDF